MADPAGTSEGDVELVRRGLTALLDQDWDTALDTLDPEVEVHDFDIPDAGIYHGHDGFERWLAGWAEAWEAWRVEDLEFHGATGGHVLALFRMITKGAGSGIEVGRRDAVLYRVAGGKIVRLEYFNDQAKALEAAGLAG